MPLVFCAHVVAPPSYVLHAATALKRNTNDWTNVSVGGGGDDGDDDGDDDEPPALQHHAYVLRILWTFLIGLPGASS